MIDSRIYGNVSATPDIKAIWSDIQRTDHFLLFEAALAKVHGKIGIILQKAADTIVKHCDVDEQRFW